MCQSIEYSECWEEKRKKNRISVRIAFNERIAGHGGWPTLSSYGPEIALKAINQTEKYSGPEISSAKSEIIAFRNWGMPSGEMGLPEGIEEAGKVDPEKKNRKLVNGIKLHLAIYD